jgi:DNA modification methylase
MFKYNSGAIGLRDFRGKIIQAMSDGGWIYFGEVTIDKNPQLKASRTKDSTLLFKTLSSDSAGCRMALADYLVVFKAPGENPVPIRSGNHQRWNPTAGWITPDEWIEWAAPVWYRKTADYPGGIKETEVIDQRPTKDAEDTKHLCPLQLGVIERAVKLWSAPGDLVFSPFAGIGSEGYVAVKLSRRFLGIELKPTYAEAASRNLKTAEQERESPGLFPAGEPARIAVDGLPSDGA